MKRMGFAGVVLAVLCLTLLMPTGAPATQHTCRVVGAGGSYGTLQEAVDAASAGDTLEVTGTCYGDTTIGKDLSIVGRGAATLDGTGTTGHVVRIGYRSPVVAITGLTITGGTPMFTGPTSEDEAGDGGGIVINAGSLTLTRSTIVGNKATEGNPGPGPLPEESVGGGILNHGQLVLDHSSVVGNTAEVGGGIYTYGELGLEHPSPAYSATLIDSTVARNVGGGLENDYFGLLALTNSAVTSNIGFGIRDGGFGGREGSATLVRSRVTRNTGVGIEPSSTFTLIDSIVTHNGGE